MILDEIFYSMSGEVSPYGQGRMTTFVRLYGCNFIEEGNKCHYCDTSQYDKIKISPENLAKSLVDSKYVCITGGEPLMQKEEVEVFLDCLPKHVKVWIETNGSYDFLDLIGKVNLVVDWKLTHEDKMVCTFPNLLKTDFIKFVINSGEEMERAIEVQMDFQKAGCKAQFAYSPNLELERYVEKIVFDKLFNSKLDAIINIQTHKLIGVK